MPPAKTIAVGRVRRRWLKRRRVVSPTGVSSHRTMLRSPFARSLRGSTFHSCSNTRGGSHARIFPVTWSRAGPREDPWVSPCGSLPLIRAVILVGAYSSHRSPIRQAGSALDLWSFSSSFLPLRFLSRAPRVQVSFEGREGVGPHRLVLRDPLVEFGQSFGLDRVDAFLRPNGHVDEARFAQYAEVFRDARLGNTRELRNDFARRSRPSGEQVEDGPPCGVGDGREDTRHEVSPEPLLELREERGGEPREVGLAQLDLVPVSELQEGLLGRESQGRDGRLRPSREPVDLQLSAIEEDRVAQDADLVQRIAVLSLDAGEPVDEHVVQKEDLVIEKTVLEFLRGCSADLPPIGTQVRLDPRAACGDVGLRIFFHPEHGIRPFAAVRGPVATASGGSRPDR